MIDFSSSVILILLLSIFGFVLDDADDPNNMYINDCLYSALSKIIYSSYER